MKLIKEEVEHIALLARLDLSKEELEKYGSQLSDVLSYIDLLKEVDTTSIEPTAQVTGMENIFRDDVVVDWDEGEREKTLEEAPELESGEIKVKRVLR